MNVFPVPSGFRCFLAVASAAPHFRFTPEAEVEEEAEEVEEAEAAEAAALSFRRRFRRLNVAPDCTRRRLSRICLILREFRRRLKIGLCRRLLTQW